MIVITDNGNGSFLLERDGVPCYIQNNKVADVRVSNNGVMIDMKSGRIHRIESYTEVSGYSSADELAEAINDILNFPCPAITLGSINFAGGAQPTVGVAITGGALITGGVAPYTLGTITGTVPAGLTPSMAENAGSWYLVLTGTPTTFGSYTFTVNGVDDHGCPITPTEFTVDVWQVFENNTPIGSDQTMLVSVSGLPAAVGTGVAIQSIEYSATVADDSGVGLFLDDTVNANQIMFFDEAELSGADFTNTKFLRGNAVDIATGAAPYTGSFSPTEHDPSGFDAFNGSATNGDWQLYFSYSVAPVGSWVYARITFKPI